MQHRNSCLTKGTRKEHERLLFGNTIDEINTRIDIDEWIAGVDDFSQFRHRIAKVVVAFINVFIQPNEIEITMLLMMKTSQKVGVDSF